MNLPTDIMDRLAEKHTTSKTLMSAAKFASDRRAGVASVKSRLALLKKEYLAAVEREEMELRIEQGKCHHPVTTYHGDPSGVSDSHTYCEICGAYL